MEALPDLSLRCRFCGALDRLPPDELGRALEIRGRLAMVASRVAQVASNEQALASIFERRGAFWSVMGPWPVLALVVTGYALFSAWSTLEALPASVPDDVRVDLAVAAAYGPFFVIGITVSFPIALLVGRMSYARNVRPKLAARPPLYAGAAMRCRACGGNLPLARDGFVTCTFCNTQNVLAADLVGDVSRGLEAELAGYRAQASGMSAGMTVASTHMTRTVFLCFALVYGGIFVVGAVLRVALVHL